MAFLDKTGLQTLTNKLVQGDAIKVASHRGKNVKEVIDNIQRECENVALPNTMTLENRINEFKVGKGRDVDVSGDVEEGKIQVELKGRTYQNIVTNTKWRIHTSKTIAYMDIDWSLLKPSTKYTLFLLNPSSKINLSKGFVGVKFTKVETHDFSKPVLLTTVSDLNNSGTSQPHIYPKNGEFFEVEDLEPVKIMLLEGDYTQTPTEEIPQFFEGIKSGFEDGVFDIEVIGKNIVDANSKLKVGMIMNDGSIANNSAWVYTEEFFKIEPSTIYNISEKLNNYKQYRFLYYNKSKEFIGKSNINGWSDTTFTTLDEAYYFKLNYSISVSGSPIERPNIQVEKGVKKTSYEPYYKKKISFNIGEPLRSLPNGVCDEIRNNNGQWELVRRVGKVILDGSEAGWKSYADKEDCWMFAVNNYPSNLKHRLYENTNLICDITPIGNLNIEKKQRSIFVYGHNTTNELRYSILKTSLSGNATHIFKQWLSENPTTVYYELETPTITPIEPIEFNISQGATVSINSDIAPISTYDAVLNRAGQIEQGIELIANLKSRINELENIYDSNLIATQYKLDNLKLNYELEREED